MIMESKGRHIELTSVDESLSSTRLFPKTTSDDVLVNDGGAVLSTYLPTIESTNKKHPIKAIESSTSTMTDKVFQALKK